MTMKHEMVSANNFEGNVNIYRTCITDSYICSLTKITAQMKLLAVCITFMEYHITMYYYVTDMSCQSFAEINTCVHKRKRLPCFTSYFFCKIKFESHRCNKHPVIQYHL